MRKVLLKLKKDKKLSNSELAKMFDTNELNIHRWLTGKHKVGRAWTLIIKNKLEVYHL